MIFEPSGTAVAIFIFFVSVVLGISFYLGAKAKSAQGYFAAHGQVHWFVNGIAFAGDYLSAASFLGICGMIAFSGYDGFLYSIGFLAGWIVALFVVAEPLKRLGRYTFADALDNKFNSRGIKLSAALSTLVISVFYLIPQMVGAGALVKPLLGLPPMLGLAPHALGVILVGAVVITIVVTAGMVSTTWVQFIKGTLLVVFCAGLTVAILNRGLSSNPNLYDPEFRQVMPQSYRQLISEHPAWERVESNGGPWQGLPYERFREGDVLHVFRQVDWKVAEDGAIDPASTLIATQYKLATTDGRAIVNGLPHGRGAGEADFFAVGQIAKLGGTTAEETGPIGPLKYFKTLQNSELIVWSKDGPITDDTGKYMLYYPRLRTGDDLLTPGASSTFAGVRSDDPFKKLDFLSLMLALFCGTASLPHILIRYYTVKDQASARKSTVVGIAAIGFFYILTLYLGLAAMTTGVLDPTDSNMAAPLLARSFGKLPFAIISAIAFTTVLGTVSGLILAASGAVAHDLAANFLGKQLTDHEKIRIAKLSAILVGIIAIILGISFEKLNVGFLVGWAFNIAASANLPALVMLLFWKKTTKQGITAAIVVGMFASLGWILLSAQAFRDVYGLSADNALVPFSQPAIVTVPLGFIVLIVVSLMTQQKTS
jgi:cation/acetate symporter